MFGLRKILQRRMEILDGFHSENLYVENVRALFGIPRSFAEYLCEKATEDGYFEKWVGLANPEDGRIICSYLEGADPPTFPVSDIQAVLGEKDRTEFEADELRRIIYYRIPVENE